MDLEVLITPPMHGETSTGGPDPSVVDDGAMSVRAAGPGAHFHLLWSSVKVTAPVPTEPSLVRNVWSVRTLST